MSLNKVYTWKGVQIRDMFSADLIVAFEELADMYEIQTVELISRRKRISH